MEERLHYNWQSELEWDAKRGKISAQKILEEGRNPGEYFDGPTHYYDVIHTLRQLIKDPGVQAIGIFGSRLRQEHKPLKSDVDLLVINDSPIEYDWSPSRGPTASRKTYRHVGIGRGINIQECTTENWHQVVVKPDSVNQQTYDTMKSVRWLWVKEDFSVQKIS